jgi:molybdopterin molybdotransferase
VLSVDAARAIMLASVGRLGAEPVKLSDACGRILAEDVRAGHDHPGFEASSMDGYAMAAAHTPGSFIVTGEASAGRPYAGILAPGQAVRISTGAALPEGADCVSPQEDTKRDGDAIFAPATKPFAFVRRRGLDFCAGALLLRSGAKLSPAALGLGAAAGRASFLVTARPRVICLTLGDELARSGQALRRGQIFDSAGPAVAAFAATWGACAEAAPALDDDPRALSRAVQEALGRADIVVIIGGASVGPHDHAPEALKALGFELSVHGVSVRPGKPTWLAKRGSALVLGLPGNPVSALVCARLFLAPLIARALGQDPHTWRQSVPARLAEAAAANGAREQYARAHVTIDKDGALEAQIEANQDSSLLSVLARSNALVQFEAHQPALCAGARVQVLALSPEPSWMAEAGM